MMRLEGTWFVEAFHFTPTWLKYRAAAGKSNQVTRREAIQIRSECHVAAKSKNKGTF